MMEDEVVRRRGWLTREEFLDLISAVNLIPGPNSTELAIPVDAANPPAVALFDVKDAIPIVHSAPTTQPVLLAGDAEGITCFIVPTATPGLTVEFMWWTFNMPSDLAEVTLRDVRVPHRTIFGAEGRGLALAQHFVHENRSRQAASGGGAAQYCINESVAYAKERMVFGKPLWLNQAIQIPLAELQTECEMVRNLVHKTAWLMDQQGHMDVSDKVSMCNYRANRLVCEAADTAIQVHGGIGYTRHKPFEHIYRHHRRYRITEGSDEIQIRRVAGVMFGRQAKRA